VPVEYFTCRIPQPPERCNSPDVNQHCSNDEQFNECPILAAIQPFPGLRESVRMSDSWLIIFVLQVELNQIKKLNSGP